MKLLSASISGFRRFADETTVRLAEPLIALVGSNESGKSSFLEALRQLDHERPISPRDVTRRSSLTPGISLKFELEDADHEALAPLSLPVRIRHCTFTKSKSGQLHVTLDPAPPPDLSSSAAAVDALAKLSKIIGQMKARAPKEQAKAQDLIKTAAEALRSTKTFLPSEAVFQLKELVARLESQGEALPATDRNKAKLPALIEPLNGVITTAPARAIETVKHRRPRILFFDDESRDLRSSYDLAAETKGPPVALANLARLAKLDVKQLTRVLKADDQPHVQELINSANEVLKSEFATAWVRDDVVPWFHTNGSILYVSVSTPDSPGLSAIDERSDGLRWFIALRAFFHDKENLERPILLVDEADRHLSYDAQASLIGVLESQQIAQRVIYTTHSAGCLPSDLGTGIRPVIPLEGERSRIVNSFWTIGIGFSPLLLAMGLGPLAFTPYRNVVIGEGASECVLLPTLLRQAAGARNLPFQVAPGASNAGASDLPDLLAEGGRVAFVLDGDQSGADKKELLIAAGADPDQVRTYADFFDEPVVFEELIDAAAYVDAINDELQSWQQPAKLLTADDLPHVGRAAAVERWCDANGLKPITKATLCQRLAEVAAGGTPVLAAERRDALNALYEWLVGRFQHAVR